MEDGRFVVRAELPGMSPENIDVFISDGVLTVQAERNEREVEITTGISVRRDEPQRDAAAALMRTTSRLTTPTACSRSAWAWVPRSRRPDTSRSSAAADSWWLRVAGPTTGPPSARRVLPSAGSVRGRPATSYRLLVLGSIQRQFHCRQFTSQPRYPVAAQGTDPLPGPCGLGGEQFGGCLAGGVFRCGADRGTVGRLGVRGAPYCRVSVPRVSGRGRSGPRLRDGAHP